MRIATDGYMDVSEEVWIRMPGYHDERLEPLPEREALSFLLSHSFKGARRIVRRLSAQHCSTLQKAMWADSVNQRMNLVDRVWRAITEPAEKLPRPTGEEQLIQIILYGESWAYPLYLKGDTVRVAPEGGLPLGEVKGRRGAPKIDLRTL